MDERNSLQRLFGYCPQCGRWFRRVRTARQNTAYHEDEKNFFTGCRTCEEENDRYWAEMWNEYYGIVAPAHEDVWGSTLYRKIVFLGWDARQTDQYLSQMAMDNADQVDRYDRLQGRLKLTDGTEIINAYRIGKIHGRKYDQVILADDRRMEIMEHHRNDIAELLRRCQSSIIPEEFHLQFYDIDEEV